MTPLPFTLRMPSQDHSADGLTSWSTFKVPGLLHFDDGELLLEWEVTATTDEVDGLEVRSEVVPLPAEALQVPLSRLRGVRAMTGWCRPCIHLIGSDLTVFFGVPGQQQGQVRLFVARADRGLAAETAARIAGAIRPVP